jgi:hypothetical protein
MKLKKNQFQKKKRKRKKVESTWVNLTSSLLAM